MRSFSHSTNILWEPTTCRALLKRWVCNITAAVPLWVCADYRGRDHPCLSCFFSLWLSMCLCVCMDVKWKELYKCKSFIWGDYILWHKKVTISQEPPTYPPTGSYSSYDLSKSNQTKVRGRGVYMCVCDYWFPTFYWFRHSLEIFAWYFL